MKTSANTTQNGRRAVKKDKNLFLSLRLAGISEAAPGHHDRNIFQNLTLTSKVRELLSGPSAS